MKEDALGCVTRDWVECQIHSLCTNTSTLQYLTRTHKHIERYINVRAAVIESAISSRVILYLCFEFAVTHKMTVNDAFIWYDFILRSDVYYIYINIFIFIWNSIVPKKIIHRPHSKYLRHDFFLEKCTFNASVKCHTNYSKAHTKKCAKFAITELLSS